MQPWQPYIILRYLAVGRKTPFIGFIGLLSMIGIGLSVATLIVVLAVMRGFEKDFMQKLFGFHGHLTVYGIHQNLSTQPSLAKALAKRPEVISAQPFLEIQGIFEPGMTPLLIRALPDETKKQMIVLPSSFQRGDMDQDCDPNHSLWVSEWFGKKWGLQLGDFVSVFLPDQTADREKDLPIQRIIFQIAGWFKSGMMEYDQGIGWVSWSKGAKLLNLLENQASGWDICLKKPSEVDMLLKQAIADCFEERVHITDWQESNGRYLQVMRTERSVMVLILSLMMAVSAFNVFSTLSILVKHKMHDIGILKTMGATPDSIQKLFIAIGAFVGFLGIALGAPLGILVAFYVEPCRKAIESLLGKSLLDADVYGLNCLPSHIESSDVAWIVVLAMFLTLVASWYPAWRASRLSPRECLLLA